MQREFHTLMSRFGMEVSCILFCEITMEHQGESFTATNQLDYNITPTRKLGMAQTMVLLVEQNIRRSTAEPAPQQIVVPPGGKPLEQN